MRSTRDVERDSLGVGDQPRSAAGLSSSATLAADLVGSSAREVVVQAPEGELLVLGDGGIVRRATADLGDATAEELLAAHAALPVLDRILDAEHRFLTGKCRLDKELSSL